MPNENGHLQGRTATGGGRARPPAGALPWSQPAAPRFTGQDAADVSVSLFLNVATLLIGLGSTGSALVAAVIDRLHRHLGGRQLPRAIGYRLIDAAAKEPGWEQEKFLSLGETGSGTDPAAG